MPSGTAASAASTARALRDLTGHVKLGRRHNERSNCSFADDLALRAPDGGPGYPELRGGLQPPRLFHVRGGADTVALVLHGWETNERVLESGAFESRQRVLARVPLVEHSESGARWLGLAYWQAVGGFTRGGVRARWGAEGGRLVLLGVASLLCFGPAELACSDDLVSCRYSIRGGLLALRAGGSVTLAQRWAGEEVELSVVVEEYLPRLAARAGAPWWTGALYAKGQSPFHAAVSRRYFELLASRVGT